MYAGTFITLARAEFSNSSNARVDTWSHFIKGEVKRQDFLAVALEWVANHHGVTVEGYLAEHRHDNNIDELSKYFYSVIDWIDSLFHDPKKEMRGLKWGELYEEYGSTPYDIDELNEAVDELYGDPSVHAKKGIYEYLLSGCEKPELLQVRLFDEATKATAYTQQTKAAEEAAAAEKAAEEEAAQAEAEEAPAADDEPAAEAEEAPAAEAEEAEGADEEEEKSE